jgi:hypothetical protein
MFKDFINQYCVIHLINLNFKNLENSKRSIFEIHFDINYYSKNHI